MTNGTLVEEIIGEIDERRFCPRIINTVLKGTFDWRTLALTSSVSFLLLLILIFILVTCGCWSELHHKKVKNVNLAARRKIDLLVSNNWDQLLEKAKRVLDCRLADGKELKQFSNIVLLTGRFDFSSETEETEKILFTAVNNLVKDLPERDS